MKLIIVTCDEYKGTTFKLRKFEGIKLFYKVVIFSKKKKSIFIFLIKLSVKTLNYLKYLSILSYYFKK